MANVLLITLDQFRTDCLSVAGHALVRTPNLDSLAADCVRFTHHFNQCAPCGPSRASLHTGQYLMNHRAVANGTPVDDRFTNIARELRRIGYAPALFGYTDMAIDPRMVERRDDPRLRNWEEACTGFDVVVNLDSAMAPWGRWLASLGYDVPSVVGEMFIPQGHRWGPTRYAADPNQMVSNLDSAPAFTAARNMLARRMQHAERTLSGVMIDRQGLRGRLPQLPFEP